MRMNTLLLVATEIIGVLVAGCSRSPGDDGERRVVHEVAIMIASGDSSRLGEFTNTVHEILGSHSAEGFSVKLFSNLEKAVSSSQLSRNSLHDRGESIEAYLKIVTAISECERGEKIPESHCFAFRLRSLTRLHEEMNAAMANRLTMTNEPPMGFITSARDYVALVHRQLFDAVRNGFEDNRAFGTFFHSLGSDEKVAWQSHVEKVAQRRILILDPERRIGGLPAYTAVESPLIKDEESYDDYVNGQSVRMHRVKRKPVEEKSTSKRLYK